MRWGRAPIRSALNWGVPNDPYAGRVRRRRRASRFRRCPPSRPTAAELPRPGRLPRALQGAGRDQHHAVGRQLHAGRRADGGAPEGGRLSPTATCTCFVRARATPRRAAWWRCCPGPTPRPKAILLLAHIDVVEAKREDWTRDPFTLVEENGYFYARGAGDDKAQAAIWVDTLIRFKQRGLPAQAHDQAGADLRRGDRRRLQRRRVAGQEPPRPDRRRLRAQRGRAAGGSTAHGKPRRASASRPARRSTQNYRLEVTNPGGHSSRPVQDNAIYHLAGALVDGSAPTSSRSSSTTPPARYFARHGQDRSAARRGAGHEPRSPPIRTTQAAAADRSRRPELQRDAAHHLRRHHARRAATPPTPCRSGPRANVNCRILPGESVEEVRGHAGEGGRRPGGQDHALAGEREPGLAAAAADAADHRPGREGRRADVARRAGGAGHVHRRHRRPLPDRRPASRPTASPACSATRTAAASTASTSASACSSLYEGREFLYRLVKLYADQP